MNYPIYQIAHRLVGPQSTCVGVFCKIFFKGQWLITDKTGTGSLENLKDHGDVTPIYLTNM